MHNETLVVYHLQKFPENPISKWNTTFWVVGSCGKVWEQPNIAKGSPVVTNGN